MGKTKKSTSFPDVWNRVKVINKVREAYQNPLVTKGHNGFIGITEEGIKIQFWFLKDPSTGRIVLNSKYPYIKV